MLNKCLGRKPAVFSPHTPALTALAPTILHYNPQPEIMRGSEIPSWLMGMNDSIGSCTSVGIANILLARNTWAGHTNYPTTADILSFYERFGYKPGQPLTDQGATLLECMQSWMQLGYPVRNTTNKLKGFAAINFRNLTLLKTAIEIFGDVYTGVNLTVAQQTQTVWDYVPNDQEWGGHAVSLNSFAEDGSFRVVTWAEWMKVTPAFIEHQVEEAYVLLDDASLARAQRTFNDWNMEALAQAVKSLGGQLA